MILSKHLVGKYQNIYKTKFNKDISTKDAERELLGLKELVRLIVKERRNRHGK